MVRPIHDASEHLRQLAGKARGEVDLSTFLAQHHPLDDEQLAEVIDQDGRIRLGRGKAVTLERYIQAVPDLLDRPDPLDAAIDVTLRSLSRSSHPDDQAIEKLIARYPQLADSIEEAAALNNALWSTTGLRLKLSQQTTRELPQEFGPPVTGSQHHQPRYLLQQLLGSGAFGDVYLAVDRQLSDDGHRALVAVKILNNHQRQPRARRVLAEEAAKARRIDHPNVVRVLDRGISQCNEDYIVYEYVDGGDLGHWLRTQPNPIPVRQAVQLAAQVARGVQAAHAAGLVHCDLKPGNIMIKAPQPPSTTLKHGNSSTPAATPIPKVADFGIAIRAGESLPDIQCENNPPHPIGNLAYISPEQYRMEHSAFTVPSDIYALGGILFNLLTNHLPNGSTAHEIAENHHPERGRTHPPSLRTLRREIDHDLEAICQRAMAISPTQRHSGAGALADDLDAWLRGEPIYWTRPSIGRIARLWIKRRPALTASLLIGGMLLIGGIGMAGHYAIAARDAAALALQHEQQTEIERLRADQQEKINTARVQTVERVRDQLHELAKTSPATTQMLSLAWVNHHVFGTEVLDVSADVPSFDRVRMQAVERRIQWLEDRGQGQSLEARMWQTNLVFWLIGGHQVERAEPLLAELQVAWREILEPADTWLDLLDAFEAALVVRTHSKHRSQSEAAATHLSADRIHESELIEAEQVLVRFEQAQSAGDPGNPVHYLVLDVMKDLYSPHLLDRPARLDEVTKRMIEMFGHSRFDRENAS